MSDITTIHGAHYRVPNGAAVEFERLKSALQCAEAERDAWKEAAIENHRLAWHVPDGRDYPGHAHVDADLEEWVAARIAQNTDTQETDNDV